jgi:acylphosphatase
MSDAGVERVDATVRGNVQGVGFRWFVRRQAAGLGLTGWTANQPDGSVRVVLEGPRGSLDRMAALLREGPPGSVVDQVDLTGSVATGEFKGFDIRAGGHRGD